jgi:hypothetical protein
MTAHELARKLLNGPDLPVLSLADEERDVCLRVGEPDEYYAWEAKNLERRVGPAWFVMPFSDRINPPANAFRVIYLSTEWSAEPLP